MTRIAHISDLHVLDLHGIQPMRYLNKRATGLASLWTSRRDAHSIRILESLMEELDRKEVDHILVTGDISNLSLESEFARAREILGPLATFDRMSIVPGNHDVYTRGAHRAHRFESYFGDLMWTGPPPPPAFRYPWYKRVDGVHVVGMSSAVPTLPLMATGRVGDEQLGRMEALSAEHDFHSGFTIGMVHHNLHDRSLRKNLMHGMQDRHDVVQRCAAAGVNLLLHGHTHVAHRFQHQQMRIVGCGSSTWTGPHPDRLARYNIYHVEDDALSRVEMHRYDLETQSFEGIADGDMPAH